MTRKNFTGVGYPFAENLPAVGADLPGVGIPFSGGSYWFVDQVNGTDGNSGRAINDAVASIGFILDFVQAGDTVVIAPGSYEENLTITTDYITFVGWSPSGYARPDIVPTTGSALQVTTGQGFVAKHVRFYSADADVVIQNANGFKYEDCVFDGDSGQASTELLLRLVPSATDDSYSASEGKILNNLFRGSNGSGIGFQHALAAGGGEGTSDNEIAYNRFINNAVSDLKSFVNTNGGGAGIILSTSIHDNQFMTSGAAYKYINFAAGAAGDLTANNYLISANYFADEALTGGAGNQIDLGGQAKAHFAGNFDDAGVVNGTTFNN